MKTIVLIVLLTISFTVHADESDCEALSGLAELIMKNRQKNIDIMKMINIANNSKSEYTKNVSILLIKEAYSRPLYHTEENKIDSINTFKNDIGLMCIENEDK